MTKEIDRKINSIIGIVLGILFIAWLFWPISDVSLNDEYKSLLENDMFSNIEEYHFQEMPITYSINIDTTLYSEGGIKRADDDYEVQRIKWALNIIENETDNLVTFKEVSPHENPNIIIEGYPPLEESDPTLITEGLAGPIDIVENVIIFSEVDFYPANTGFWGGTTSLEVRGDSLWEITDYDLRESISWVAEDCENFPNTEIHEILHAFSFDHNYNNSYSVMAPIKHKIQSCKTKRIDERIVSCLKYIYSDGKAEGDCQNLKMYPWSEEPEIEDFKWEELPITYSVYDCNERQIRNVQQAEKLIEDHVGYNLYQFNEVGIGKINFHCMDSFDDILLNEETDFWDETVYFPSAQPSFKYNLEGYIEEVEIILFAQDRVCGGIEVHELLHGIGLRNHYSHWMEYETKMCYTNVRVIGTEAIEKLKEIYYLN